MRTGAVPIHWESSAEYLNDRSWDLYVSDSYIWYMLYNSYIDAAVQHSYVTSFCRLLKDVALYPIWNKIREFKEDLVKVYSRDQWSEGSLEWSKGSHGVQQRKSWSPGSPDCKRKKQGSSTDYFRTFVRSTKLYVMFLPTLVTSYYVCDNLNSVWMYLNIN